MRKCVKCKIEKELNDFSKDKKLKDELSYQCKSCFKEYYEANKEKIKEQKKEYQQTNKEKIKERKKEHYEANKEKINKQIKEYQQTNKEKIKEYRKKHYQANKKKIKEYHQANKERINKLRRERKKADPLFKMKCNLRARTWSAFKNNGYTKNTKTKEMLGVDWEVCKAHIERQFTKGMSWDNQGDWHVDHIIPLSSANTEEELKKLCHYSNLQPLWAVDNLMKSDKINGQQNKFRF